MTLIKKLKSGLKKLDDLEVKLLGNRLTVLGHLLVINAAASITAVNPDDYLRPIIGMVGGIAGAILAAGSSFGDITYERYKEVEWHIKTEGTPDKRFLRNAMRVKEKLRLDSYCDIQGAYLACRNYGYEKEFWEVKKESNNLIPNF